MPLPDEKVSRASSSSYPSVILVEIILKSAYFPSWPPAVRLDWSSDLQRIHLSTIAEPFFHPYSYTLHGMNPIIFFSSPWLLAPQCSFILLLDNNPVPVHSETSLVQSQSCPPGLYRYCVTLAPRLWSILCSSLCESYFRLGRFPWKCSLTSVYFIAPIRFTIIQTLFPIAEIGPVNVLYAFFHDENDEVRG